MIDHIGLSVADYEKSKSFYSAALAPLGYQFIIEAPKEHTGGARAAHAAALFRALFDRQPAEQPRAALRARPTTRFPAFPYLGKIR